VNARKIVPVVVALAVLGGGFAIVASSMQSGVFNLTLEEALAASETLGSKEFKVGGNVMEGTIAKGSNTFETLFAITDIGGHRLDCLYQGALPDPFAEGREVIVQGHLEGPTRMRVSKITVKCPSKYQEAGVTEEQADQYYKGKYETGHQEAAPAGAPPAVKPEPSRTN
jgi:cytochrome c-type biogenesis protein CcmE